VVHYVLSLSGTRRTIPSRRSGAGREVRDGLRRVSRPEGKGNQALGAPNLTDKVWLYGGSVATISETINAGRNNVMPKFKDILTGPEIHLVAAYVWSLTNDAKAAAPPAAPSK
jgi:cytochrome c oxidase cbb3-type subunit III